ncbi:hypothetical protein S40288_05378 [Stachybotrys chartarum IBT 40288]|nr:hypothetical protein S40288_05378 [Stachybotrys chartarum IBT 40288]
MAEPTKPLSRARSLNNLLRLSSDDGHEPGSAVEPPDSPTDCPVRNACLLLSNTSSAKVVGIIAVALLLSECKLPLGKSNWSCPFKGCKYYSEHTKEIIQHVSSCAYFSPDVTKIYCNHCLKYKCPPPTSAEVESPGGTSKSAIKKTLRDFTNLFARSRPASQAPSRASGDPESPSPLSNVDRPIMVPPPLPRGEVHGAASVESPRIDETTMQAHGSMKAKATEKLPHTDFSMRHDLRIPPNVCELTADVAVPPHELAASVAFGSDDLVSPNFELFPSSMSANGVFGDSRVTQTSPMEDLSAMDPRYPDWDVLLGDLSPTSPQIESSQLDFNPSMIFQHITPLEIQKQSDAQYVMLRHPSPQRRTATYSVATDPLQLAFQPKDVPLANPRRLSNVPMQQSSSTMPSSNFDTAHHSDKMQAIIQLIDQHTSSSESSRMSLYSPSVAQKTDTSPSSDPSPTDSQVSVLPAYKCPYCEYRPTGIPKYWLVYLNKHISQHTSRKIPCPDCGKEISRKDNLKTHQRNSCPKSRHAGQLAQSSKRNAEGDIGCEDDDGNDSHLVKRIR